MTDEEFSYLHPGYKKPYPIETVLRDLAAQEGCDGEPYDAMAFAADAITTLRAQLADQKRFKDRIVAEASDALETMQKRCEAANVRADRAEAAVAAQIEVDAGLIDSIAAEAARSLLLGDAQDRAVLEMMKSLSNAIRAQPHDRSALDAVKRAAKVEAWKEAADLVGNAASGFPDNVAWCVEDLAAAILALIEREGV